MFVTAVINVINGRLLSLAVDSACQHNMLKAHVTTSTHDNIYTWWRHDMEMFSALTHWGRVTHICISKITIIGSDNGLSPGRRQAIIWTNAGILLIGPLGIKFSEILIEINTFSFKKMHLKLSSAKRRPFCLCLNELMALCDHYPTLGCENQRILPIVQNAVDITGPY